MNIESIKVKVGDKFSTENGTIKPVLGEEVKTGNSRKAQIKEVQRFIAYEKTGKINPKTKKVSNEIIVTEVYNEPKPKVERGRPNEYAQYFVAWMRSLCNSDGLYSMNELLLNGGIIRNTNQMDVYKTLDEIQAMTKEEFKEYKAEKNYKYLLKVEFKSKVVSALKKLQKEVPSLEWKTSYRVTYEKDRKEWTEASDEECILIEMENERCQKEICKKYHCDSFNKIKWDNEKFFEYSELLDENLIDKYGIYGKVWVISIIGNSEVLDGYDVKDYVCGYLEDEIYPQIKALMKDRMECIIKKASYDPNKYNKNASGLGRRNSNIIRDKVYTLKFSKSVLSFHVSIFGRIDAEYFKEMYRDEDGEEIGVYYAKKHNYHEKYFASQDLNESVITETIEISDCDEDDDNPFGIMENDSKPKEEKSNYSKFENFDTQESHVVVIKRSNRRK